jgi:hypothetical protein
MCLQIVAWGNRQFGSKEYLFCHEESLKKSTNRTNQKSMIPADESPPITKLMLP